MSGSLVIGIAPAQANESKTATGVAVKATSCNPQKYASRYKEVRGSVQRRLSHVETEGIPGRKTIERGEQRNVNHTATFGANVTHSGQVVAGGSGMLKKVISIYGEASQQFGFTGSYSRTTTRNVTVTNKETMAIQGPTAVVWYRGWKVVSGTFKRSYCHALNARSGDVRWRSYRWKSYGVKEYGGQRCDRAAHTSVQKLAKRVGCS